MTAPSMEWDLSALVYLSYLFFEPITHSRQDLGSPPKKVYPWGAPPRISSRPKVPPRDVSPPISFSHGVSKVRCALRVSSFQFDQCYCFKMVNSLQSIVLFSVPIAVLFDMLKILHHLPMGHECFRALFRRCTHEELRAWAKTLPWDHPIARKLDHEVHRRRMAGEFYGFSFFSGVGPFFLIPFLIFIEVFKGFDFLRTVLWPVHLCLCPRRARLNWAARFWVPTCSC